MIIKIYKKLTVFCKNIIVIIIPKSRLKNISVDGLINKIIISNCNEKNKLSVWNDELKRIILGQKHKNNIEKKIVL